jgi:hypothetical protein
MKRTNVILDEKLLEEARRVTGEKTYSATITKALEKVVKRKKFWESYKRFEEIAAKGDFFWPGYLEELRPNAYPVAVPERRSAHEKRAPKKKKEARGSR